MLSVIRRTSSEVAGRAKLLIKCLAKFGERSLPPLRWPRLCRRPFTSTNIYRTKSSLGGALGHPMALQSGNWSPDSAHVCPKVTIVSPTMPRDGHLEHHWGLITSKSIKNTLEYCYFQDSHKVIFSSLVGSLFALRDRKSGPKSAQEGHRRPRRLPFRALR